jgi:hypothetical protein
MKEMDLTRAISGMQQAKVMGRVQMAVARKIIDTQHDQGAAAIKLIQAAANAGSQAGDQLVAAATGLGGSLDTYA